MQPREHRKTIEANGLSPEFVLNLSENLHDLMSSMGISPAHIATLNISRTQFPPGWNLSMTTTWKAT